MLMDVHHACTYPMATQKGIADLCLYQLATVHVQMHAHTGNKIFLLYVAIAASTSNKRDNQESR